MTGGRSFGMLFVLALAPSTMLAQRGILPGGSMGTGGMGRGRPGAITRESGIAIPKMVNAVNLLVENRQVLALTDTQFLRIITIKRSLDSVNAPLMRKLDSVQHQFKGGGPLFGTPSAERRDSLQQARGVIAETQSTVHDNVSDWREKAYALLSMSQLARAKELEDKAERAIAADEAKGKGRGG